MASVTPPDVHVVDNRVFLLGLDELYRRTMKHVERLELLACAREVALTLRVAPATGPVEGYYAEDARLTEYFQLMRALQGEPNRRAADVEKLRAYARLYEVTSSRLFGLARDEDKLLPTGQDALTEALEKTPRSDLTIPRVTARAEQTALAMDDYSLVGLAARTKDAVVLTALRESVVLYARVAYLGMAPGRMPRQVYEWHVDPELAQQANRFIRVFNTLFSTDEPLPEAAAKNARIFWGACDLMGIVGRCVRIGYDDTVDPMMHYHWALKRPVAQVEVEEFWAPEIWTTERYRRDRLHLQVLRGELEGLDRPNLEEPP
jgi:hypothetical protein